MLWSIAAGPLVNVLLVPITVGAWLLVKHSGMEEANPDFYRFVFSLMVMNGGLLIFNMLPIYPLDGGQILQSLLWFFLGRSRSLKVASVIGVLGGIAVIGLAVLEGSLLTGAVGAFIAFAAWAGWARARFLAQPGVEPLASGEAHLKGGDHVRAVADFTSALELLPPDPRLRAQVHTNRGLAYWRQGIYDKAVADYQDAIQLNPALATAHNNLAWLRATCPLEEWRDGTQALALAQKACEFSGWQKPACLGTLAAAYAELGSFAEAVTWQKKALEFPESRQLDEEKARQRLRGYQEGRPHRENLPSASSPGAV
jgi:tetratricopeptide (TPR) repeat protein